MTFFPTNASTPHIYKGVYSEVKFFLNDQDELNVTIETDRLRMRSVQSSEEDYSSYAALFGDQDVMEKYGAGTTSTRKEIERRIDDIWVKRWHQKDPYSGLAVFKKSNGKFLGHVVVGHGDEPGRSELAYLFVKKYWRKKFGTEAVTALVKEYAPATVKEGFTLEGKVLERIDATVRPDNPGSIGIATKIGMHKIGEEEKYNALRYRYSIELSELINKV